jgi:hypothetical protein
MKKKIKSFPSLQLLKSRINLQITFKFVCSSKYNVTSYNHEILISTDENY